MAFNVLQPSQLNSFAVILKIWGSPHIYRGSKEVIGRTVTVILYVQAETSIRSMKYTNSYIQLATLSKV